MPVSNSNPAPCLLFVAARRGIGAGALAAACAARANRAGRKSALADFRSRPHPIVAAAAAESKPPFRASRPNGGAPFRMGEVSIALGEAADCVGANKPESAVIVLTYAERDLAAARVAAERLRAAAAPWVCVAVHTPPRFPFMPVLRSRAAKALGDARVIEAPEFSADALAADALAGGPCNDPALAQAIDKLAKLAGVELGVNGAKNGNDDEEIASPPGMDPGAAVAAARRELADVV